MSRPRKDYTTPSITPPGWKTCIAEINKKNNAIDDGGTGQTSDVLFNTINSFIMCGFFIFITVYCIQLDRLDRLDRYYLKYILIFVYLTCGIILFLLGNTQGQTKESDNISVPINNVAMFVSGTVALFICMWLPFAYYDVINITVNDFIGQSSKAYICILLVILSFGYCILSIGQYANMSTTITTESSTTSAYMGMQLFFFVSFTVGFSLLFSGDPRSAMIGLVLIVMAVLSIIIAIILYYQLKNNERLMFEKNTLTTTTDADKQAVIITGILFIGIALTMLIIYINVVQPNLLIRPYKHLTIISGLVGFVLLCISVFSESDNNTANYASPSVKNNVKSQDTIYMKMYGLFFIILGTFSGIYLFYKRLNP